MGGGSLVGVHHNNLNYQSTTGTCEWLHLDFGATDCNCSYLASLISFDSLMCYQKS